MVAEEPAQADARHPPGHRLARGPPLHRRAAQPQALATGSTIKAPRAFRIYRDGLPAGSRAVNRRGPHMQDIFSRLDKAGVDRGELYLAWDFTIASRQGLTKRLLSIRDRSFAELGDRNLRDLEVAGAAPQFTVTEARDVPGDRPPRERAPSTVPCWLDKPGCPPGGALQAEQARPAGAHRRQRAAGAASSASCRTSSATTPGAAAAVRPRPVPGRHRRRLDRPARAGVERGHLRHELHRACRRRTWPTPRKVSVDLSRFPTIADRLQQGILDFMFLGRAMIHPQGFSSNPEFAGRIDTDAALLRGRQPGRHHRRGADLGRARLRPLGADRAGAALQPAAHAQHAVPELRPDPLRQVPGPGRAGAGQLDDPAALGPRRGERLRLPHGPRPAAQHARRRRCCCTRRSATTR